MAKKDKYGSYVRKVGHYDIRQKIKMPIKKKDRVSGGYQTVPGSVEIFIYHGKKVIESGFKSHMEAEIRARELQKMPLPQNI